MIGERLSYWGWPLHTRLKNLIVRMDHRVCELQRETFFDLVYLRLRAHTNRGLYQQVMVDTQ